MRKSLLGNSIPIDFESNILLLFLSFCCNKLNKGCIKRILSLYPHLIHLIISNDRVFAYCFFKTSECELIRKQAIQRMYFVVSWKYTKWWYKTHINTTQNNKKIKIKGWNMPFCNDMLLFLLFYRLEYFHIQTRRKFAKSRVNGSDCNRIWLLNRCIRHRERKINWKLHTASLRDKCKIIFEFTILIDFFVYVWFIHFQGYFLCGFLSDMRE